MNMLETVVGRCAHPAEPKDDAADAQPGLEPLAAQGEGVHCVLCRLPEADRLGQRLADMGFCPGAALRVVRRAPLGDPLEIDLEGARICIRAAEAEQVLVHRLAQTGNTHPGARP
ncbi:Fe2+ transport system protein FeoA [Humidesulfovibrio mexicanus]|jgi:ferrous iron transport protein A|uniref:Fe2+ transport system protein FeoA n=1 Tax=Humidesulfovibrio mexicanus TaxID=147047 RepID=A0A239D732_9BACT|nr:FeoA family protein [Humidesulfovibrio mexicanus]SNS28185.1 Fe2+ transport system protein FeoA [Humidesulfovibrio mexicanus]